MRDGQAVWPDVSGCGFSDHGSDTLISRIYSFSEYSKARYPLLLFLWCSLIEEFREFLPVEKILSTRLGVWKTTI